MKTVTACAWVISPINAIQCLTAARHMEQILGIRLELHVFQYYPTQDSSLAHAVFDTINAILKSYDPSIPCHFIAHENHERDTGNIPSGGFIFYPHDVVGGFLKTLRRSSPKAKLVCYGDALGQFYERDVHLGLIGLKPAYLGARIKVAAKKMYGNFARTLIKTVDYAVLTIPVSQAPLPLRTKLLVPPKEIILSVVERIVSGHTQFGAYCQSLVDHAAAQGFDLYLFLTENMAEGGFISFDDEMSLYCEAIERHARPGSTILIKPHPGEQLDRGKSFAERLGSRYKILTLDSTYHRYPVELFLPFLRRAQVIGMFYPALSLKYLYNMDVAQPMDNALIDRYFAPAFRESYKNAIELNMLPLSRLSSWNGVDMLYNGA